MIKNWTVCDLSLDVIVYCIQHCGDLISANDSEDKKLKCINTAWKFLELLLLYFQQQRFDGQVFLNGEVENQETGGAGFGLRIVKAICTRYGEKSGPYSISRVKKQLSVWSKKILERHGSTQSKMLIANFCREGNILKEVENIIFLHFPNLDDTVKNKKWYWFNDKNDSQWRPFGYVDCKKLNFAWLNMSKSCLVANGHVRVEFDRSNVLVPRGNQFTDAPTVICSDSIPKKQKKAKIVKDKKAMLHLNNNDEDKQNNQTVFNPLINEIQNLVGKVQVLKRKMQHYEQTVNDLKNENEKLIELVQQREQNDKQNEKKWYWFNDKDGLQWTPYKKIDCQKLDIAWFNNWRSCLVVDGHFRVEFNRSNPSTPCGNQFNNRKNNSGGRTVVCSIPKSQISGVNVGHHTFNDL